MKRGMLKCLIVTLSVLALVSTARAEDLIDPGQLNFRVTKVEHMNTAVPCFSAEKGRASLRPKPGWEGYVLTLEGKIPKRGILLLDPSGFYAVYDDLVRPGKVRLSHASAMCIGAFIGKELFVYAKEQTYYQKAFDPGPITTRLLFYLPKAVTEFRVAYPRYIEEPIRVKSEK